MSAEASRQVQEEFPCESNGWSGLSDRLGHILSEASSLATRLNGSIAIGNHKEATLHASLRSGFEMLRTSSRHHATDSYRQYFPDATPDSLQLSLFTTASSSPYPHTNVDSVLRYLVAALAGVAAEFPQLEQMALNQYDQAANEYDRLFGELIPDEFRHAASYRAASAAFADGSNSTSMDDWEIYCGRLKMRQQQPMLGVATGLPGLDNALRGLRGITFLGGAAGEGKTSLALSVSVSALRANPHVAVLYYSLDMAKETLYDRLLCLESGLDYSTLFADQSAKSKKCLKAAHERLRAEILPRLRIVEAIRPNDETATLDQLIVRDVVQLNHATRGATILTIIDYFQLLPIFRGKGSPLEDDHQRMEAIKKVLAASRGAGRPTGFPFLVVSEVRKGESGRKELSMDDLLGSSRLTYGAEAILLLEQCHGSDWNDRNDRSAAVQLRISKGRDGTIRTVLPMVFDFDIYRFRELPRARVVSRSRPSSQHARRIDPLGGRDD